MVEVLFRGEWVEKSYANLILERESNPGTPEYKAKLEQEAKEKAQAEEQRKKLQQEQKQKRAESKLKEQYIQEKLQQFKQEFPGEWSDAFARKQLERAHNSYYYDLKFEQDRKEHEEQQRQMAEKEKRNREQRELQRKAIAKSKSPEYQIQLILSPDDDYDYKTWYACRRPFLFDYYGRSTQPLVDRLVRTGELMKRLVGQKAYNRLVEFGKPGETWEDCMNRLLDMATAAPAPREVTHSQSG